MQHYTDAILEFWFGGADDSFLSVPRSAWFKKDDVFDGVIRERFLETWRQARAGELPPDTDDARRGLAWLILTDQFPRNLFRGSAEAFATDGLALAWARRMVELGLDRQLPHIARTFVYLPFEHSESLADQDEAVRLFETMAEDAAMARFIDYAHRHRDVIVRFGRFPHRNAALGRVDTPDERTYLAEPGAGF
ncbi:MULTISPECIES: DUF924 family protein [Chromobacterium]|uniref:DUF924 family protein n=1 Tax=Chromobacterium TaxID=535 RepID=UPI0018885B63|nr:MULTISPECIES: DUF924 family protein [Chromobacterium]QOZ83608.1 DUF924 domain-containing protein [Chromobacterium sp. Rain0013]WON83725.1 DUF924 domain-containing protein [Chromobacterium haemolyticum]